MLKFSKEEFTHILTLSHVYVKEKFQTSEKLFLRAVANEGQHI